MKISIASGGFDPIHSGHIDYLKDAASLGDRLIVLLNSDNWLVQKKGKFFMPFHERKIILENFSFVSEVVSFNDDEFGSCVDGINKVKHKYPNCNILFCNGGDRLKDNIPEMDIPNIDFKFGVGGNFKTNSSSSILSNWKKNTVDRLWGNYNILYENKGIKVKELVIKPMTGMSYQRHFHRSELWFIFEGYCEILYNETDDKKNNQKITLKKDDSFFIKRRAWHQIINPSNEICKIVEIQYGSEVNEEDIERLYYFKRT